MKAMRMPTATTRPSRSVVLDIDLYLDRHDAANDQVANEDHEDGDDDQDPADEVAEHRLEVRGRHEEHERRQKHRQGRDDRARRSRLGGERLDLALDADALADRVGDVVEDLGEVATDRAVDRVGRGHQVEVVARDALGDVAQRLVRRATEVHLADGTAELVTYRRHRVLGHGVDRLGERVTGLQSVGQQRERVTQLAVELLQPLGDAIADVEGRDEVADDRPDREKDDAQASERDVEAHDLNEAEKGGDADLDHEELGGAQLQVGPLQLFSD